MKMALALNTKTKQKTRALHLPKEYAITKHPLPPPKGGIPLKPYPRWLCLPLESKLPVGRLPADDFTMTIGRLSRKVYQTRPEQEFDLSDPYLRYRPILEYNALHDPNLRRFFRRAELHRYLHKNGLLTSSDRIVCRKLSEFNQYRRYLYRVYINEIRQYRAREKENLRYRRAIHECRRIEKNWTCEEYARIQKRRSRCVDLCRMLRDLDDAERKRYLKYFSADIERQTEWQIDKLKNAIQSSRVTGIARQLTEFKGIKERIDKQKQLILREWMHDLNKNKFTEEETKRIKEIERHEKELGHIVQIGVYKDDTLFLKDGIRKLDDPKVRKKAVAQRKNLVDVRRKNTYAEYVRYHTPRHLKKHSAPKKPQTIEHESAKSEEEVAEEEEELGFDASKSAYEVFMQREPDDVSLREESFEEEETSQERKVTFEEVQQKFIFDEEQKGRVKEKYYHSEEEEEEFSEKESLLEEEIERKVISIEEGEEDEEIVEKEWSISDRREEEISLPEKKKEEKPSLSEEQEEETEENLPEEEEEQKPPLSEKQEETSLSEEQEETEPSLSAKQKEEELSLSQMQEELHQEVLVLEKQEKISEEQVSVSEKQDELTQSGVFAEIPDEEIYQDDVSLVQEEMIEEKSLLVGSKEEDVVEEDASLTEEQQALQEVGSLQEIEEETIINEGYFEEKEEKEFTLEDITIEDTQELLEEDEYSFEEYFEEEGEQISQKTAEMDECEEATDEIELPAELDGKSSEMIEPLKIIADSKQNIFEEKLCETATDLGPSSRQEETEAAGRDSVQPSSAASIEIPRELKDSSEIQAEETISIEPVKQPNVFPATKSAASLEIGISLIDNSEICETPNAASIKDLDIESARSPIKDETECSNVELPQATVIETVKDFHDIGPTETSKFEGAVASYSATLEGLTDESAAEKACETPDNGNLDSSDVVLSESPHITQLETSDEESNNVIVESLNRC